MAESYSVPGRQRFTDEERKKPRSKPTIAFLGYNEDRTSSRQIGVGVWDRVGTAF